MKKNWLCRLVPGAENPENPHVRERCGAFAGLVGICCNLLLFAAKLIVGTVAKSIAITADAFNNLSDAGSSVVTVVGFKMSGKPADKEHPFGHGRIEYISGVVIAFVILMVGFELFTSSVSKIFAPEEMQSGTLAIVVLVLSMTVKLLMGLFYRSVGKQIGSTSLMAAMTDSISDVAATGGVLLSVVVFQLFHLNVDGYMGAVVAVFVFVAGIKTLKDTLGPLLGQAPDADLVRCIREKVLSYDGIIGVHDMLVHNYGPNRWLASLHAEVSAGEDILKSHDLIDTIERDLEHELNVHTVIHMDPVETDNERVTELREMVQRIIQGIDPQLSFHDFRIVDGPSHTNLIFDLLVPYGLLDKRKKLEEEIEQQIQAVDERYFAVMTVDTSFTGEV
ncbi:MAG: cation diffusion facilitator family transporter [Firmicutes bacterium]|nr:cation diffusion facilitator family transporter [Bacillota bacterium]